MPVAIVGDEDEDFEVWMNQFEAELEDDGV